jgi:uncharacterized protein RhaS with RHS repeats
MVAPYPSTHRSRKIPRISPKIGIFGVVEYYYGYRYYHTNLGRWLSRDPIGEEGGLNLYALANNMPLSKLDYLGLKLIFDNNCNATQRAFVQRAYDKVDSYLQEAIDEMNSIVKNKSSNSICNKAFDYDSSPKFNLEEAQKILDNLRDLKEKSKNDIEVNCDCSCKEGVGKSKNVIAFVDVNDNKNKIWFCKKYFDEGEFPTTPSEKCSTPVFIHELTHEILGTNDAAGYTYEKTVYPDGCLNDAIHKSWKQKNADNWTWFINAAHFEAINKKNKNPTK